MFQIVQLGRIFTGDETVIMPVSRLDSVYRSILLNKFFTKGWGKPEYLKRIFEFKKVVANREICYSLIPYNYPITITKDEEWSDCHVLEGCFESPFNRNLPEMIPEEVKTAYFQMILPRKWNSHKSKPVCLHMAGTGDHHYWRRRNLMAKPLLKESGIASILLENPFYGLRKPKDQIRSSLHNVSDIFVMGGCLIMESIVLLNWCEQQGFGPLGLTGLSMGGHMASLAATSWPKPIALVPCLSWSTATPVFTQGVMSASIDWEVLESQYFSNKIYQNDLAKMVKVIDQDDAFLAGQHFAKHYPESMERVIELKKESKMLDKKCENDNKVTTENNGSQNSENLTAARDNNDDAKHNVENNHINNNNDDAGGNSVALSSKVETSDNRRIAEEKRAARLFPLSLLSDRFKVGDVDKLLQGVCLLPVPKRPMLSDNKFRERESLQFMRGVMDECTHLGNFERPVDTELIVAVCARNDAYVPRDGCMSLDKIWPGAEIRFIDAGHVSAYLLHQKVFRSTIAEVFERSLKKYPIDNS